MLDYNSKNVLDSIDNIRNYITRLSSSTKHAINIIINELEAEFKSHEIIEPSGFQDGETIPQYPYEYREVPNAIKIMMKIGIANDRNETNTTQYKDSIKELENKLIKIHNSVKDEG